MSFFDFLDNAEYSHLSDYTEFEEKQPKLTTGIITIDANEVRSVFDSKARFVTNGVSIGDTIQIYQTTPVSLSPAYGFFYVDEVVDENTIKISGKAVQTGSNISYRIINTSLIQAKINNIFNQISIIKNIDLEDALFQEAINKPWYNLSTSIMTGDPSYTTASGGFLGERGALDDSWCYYAVSNPDIDAATAYPSSLAASPGPLLFPYSYQSIFPDRRNGDPSIGAGTPSLLGLPDQSPRVATPYNPPTDIAIQSNLGERPTIVDEENFYATVSPEPSAPYYIGDDATRLASYASTLTTVLTIQVNAINANIAAMTEQMQDMQTRGLVKSSFYKSVVLARARLQAALSRANFHLTDPTVGVPSISVSTDPATHPRRVYITGQRLSEIDARVPQILSDQAPWVTFRYSMLSRRANKSDGSLTLINRNTNILNDLYAKVAILQQEREDIRNILDGSING